MASLNDVNTRIENVEKNKLNLSGGNISGVITKNPADTSWINGRNGVLIKIPAYQGYSAISSMKTVDGSWEMGVYTDNKMYFTYCPDANYNQNLNNGFSQVGISNDGSIYATKVYNAVWNDYAEFYPKGEETEPGDIIMLDINSKEEKYVKATEGSTTVVGVYSDSYGHLIGGDEVPLDEDFVEYNSKKYIPVGLVGRVYCKVIGKINKGDRIVVSEIAGVGRKFDAEKDNVFQIVGMAVENKESLQIDKIKVNFRAGGGVNSHYLSHFAPLNFLEVKNG